MYDWFDCVLGCLFVGFDCGLCWVILLCCSLFGVCLFVICLGSYLLLVAADAFGVCGILFICLGCLFCLPLFCWL